MTTSVTIKSTNPNHENILIEVVDANGVATGQQVLTDGEETTLYVYASGQALRITEVPKPISSN